MVDVDRCTRYAEAGLCGHAAKNAIEISMLDNSQRYVIFRNKSACQIRRILTYFSKTIKSTISDKFGFKCNTLCASSDNNRDEADLSASLPSGEKIIIEVKFGSYTDKAAGMAQFAEIFDTTAFTDALSLKQRELWRASVAKEYPDLSKQTARTVQALNSAAEKFNEHISKSGYTLSAKSQSFMEDYLLNNSGAYNSRAKNFIRFEVNKDGTEIHDVALVKKGCGTWHVEKVKLIDPGNKTARINVFAHNDTTHLRVRFTLNDKNNFHIKNTNIEIPSKYMLKSPSWNIWIRESKPTQTNRSVEKQ